MCVYKCVCRYVCICTNNYLGYVLCKQNPHKASGAGEYEREACMRQPMRGASAAAHTCQPASLHLVKIQHVQHAHIGYIAHIDICVYLYIYLVNCMYIRRHIHVQTRTHLKDSCPVFLGGPR